MDYKALYLRHKEWIEKEVKFLRKRLEEEDLKNDLVCRIFDKINFYDSCLSHMKRVEIKLKNSRRDKLRKE